MTDEEFSIVHEALRFANSGWGEEDVPRLVLLEARAWEIVNRKMELVAGAGA